MTHGMTQTFLAIENKQASMAGDRPCSTYIVQFGYYGPHPFHQAERKFLGQLGPMCIQFFGAKRECMHNFRSFGRYLMLPLGPQSRAVREAISGVRLKKHFSYIFTAFLAIQQLFPQQRPPIEFHFTPLDQFSYLSGPQGQSYRVPKVQIIDPEVTILCLFC